MESEIPAGLQELDADIARLWNAAPQDEAALVDGAYAMLDRATAVRRAIGSGPVWARARLSEGLSRLLVARQMADWGNRSYGIQALEAAIDGLRDAAAHLSPESDPAPEAVAAFRENLLIEWRAAQGEPTLDRIAALTFAGLKRRPE